MKTFEVIRIEATVATERLWPSQLLNAEVCDIGALDKSNALKLRKGRQMDHRFVCQVLAASQVDISNPVAMLDEMPKTIIGDPYTMSQMDVMKVLTQLGDGQNTSVSNVAAFGENQITKTGRGSGYLL